MLSEILHSLEGACCLVECVDDDDYCNLMNICAAHEIWKKASSMLKDHFENTSLQDLIEISNKKNPKSPKL